MCDGPRAGSAREGAGQLESLALGRLAKNSEFFRIETKVQE